MRNKLSVLLVVSALTIGPAAAQDAAGFLEMADGAIGASEVDSVHYTATGWMGAVGQNFADGLDWPRTAVQSYDMTIDYDTWSSREEYVRVQGDYPAQGGGGVPLQGEVRTVNLVSGDFAWALNNQGEANPQNQNAELRRFMIAISPHGFIKSAMAADDVSITDRYVQSQDRTLKVIGFTTMEKYRVTGEFNDQYMLERLITRIPNPVMGDMQMEIRYEEWEDAGNGIQFPHVIHGHQGDHLLSARMGMNWINLEVDDVEINVADAALTVPDNVRNAPAPQVNVASTQLGNGVWLIAGGSHNSVAVEFNDYIAVIEGPQNEDRSIAVINEAKRLIPGKPIRYMINTHHHWDHLGGARTFVAEGATVVTHETNADLYRDVVFAPQIRTLNPDRLSMNPFATTGPGPVALETVGDRHFITDGQRTLFLYHVQGLQHATDMLIAYLPVEQIVVNADLWSPPAQGAAPPANISASAISLYNNLQRLNLPVATHVPIHGQPGPHTDFQRIVGPAAAAAQQQAAL